MIRTILIVVAIGILSFIAIYFISNLGYEVSIHKVNSSMDKHLQPEKKTTPPIAHNKTMAPLMEEPLLKPTVHKTQVPPAPSLPSLEEKRLRKKHLDALHNIQRDILNLRANNGSIDLDLLDHAVEKFSTLEKNAPELKISSIIDTAKLKNMLSSLRKMNRLQADIVQITKDPDHIDTNTLNQKLLELQALQGDLTTASSFMRPSISPPLP